MIEFKLLNGIQAQAIDPDGIAWPYDTFVAFAIEDGKVIGRMALMNWTVIEGSWVAPEKRGSTLGMRLMREIEKLYLGLGKTHAVAISIDPQVSNYLERLGFEQQTLTVYSKALVKEKVTCR